MRFPKMTIIHLIKEILKDKADVVLLIDKANKILKQDTGGE